MNQQNRYYGKDVEPPAPPDPSRGKPQATVCLICGIAGLVAFLVLFVLLGSYNPFRFETALGERIYGDSQHTVFGHLSGPVTLLFAILGLRFSKIARDNYGFRGNIRTSGIILCTASLIAGIVGVLLSFASLAF